MSLKTKTTIRFMFEATEENGTSTLHERVIENVPTSIAEQIEEDFVRYLGRSGVDRYRLYRIEETGAERLLPLDFEKVRGVYPQ